MRYEIREVQGYSDTPIQGRSADLLPSLRAVIPRGDIQDVLNVKVREISGRLKGRKISFRSSQQRKSIGEQPTLMTTRSLSEGKGSGDHYIKKFMSILL